MKRNFIFVFAALCGALVAPFTASGQTYYDFALATDGVAAATSNSIIRAVGNDKALVYYETSTANHIAHIDTYGSVNRVSFSVDYKVHDMRYCNNKVYICGTYKNDAFLGYIPYNEVATSNIVMGFTCIKCTTLVSLNRMVAFVEPILGIEKIMAVGENVYQPCPQGYSPYYSCADNYALEFECQSGALTLLSSRWVNDYNNQEYISEVIETATCVAFVGYHADLSALSIHRCMKGPNMLVSDFDKFFYYPGTQYNGLSRFHGCIMKDDTIAVASLSLLGENPHVFDIRINTFDIQSMAMTTSQSVDLEEDKAEPEELVYIPQHQTLVMLQNFNFSTPSTGSGYNYTFLHLKPYNPSIYYTANGVVETSSLLPYRSVDLLFGKYYISTGGNYWLMKNALQDVVPTSCYDCGGVIVDNINKHIPKSYYHAYSGNVAFGPHNIPSTGNSQTMYPLCINQ